MLPLAVPNPCYSRFDLRRSFSPVSASQTIGEKFPNLRVRGRILCSKNIISPDVYGPLFLHSYFYLRISIDPSLFTPSRNETRRYQHDLGIEWSVSFRFGFRAVLVNFIFVDRYEIGDRSDQSQRDREKNALRKIRFDFIEGIRICPKIKKTLRFPEKSRPSISRDKTLTITCTEAEIELFFCQNNLAIK